MDLIEVLWKQDVDLGFTLVEPSVTNKKPSTSEKESEDEIEKLKALEAINATNEKEDAKESEKQEDDPWAGLPYTVDLETGEYILNSCSQSGSGSGSSTVDGEDQLLTESPLSLDNHPLAGLTDDSLGLTDTLGLENDFTSELLGGSLLGSAGVDGFLSNETLGFPDGFNLEEALQLVGLDEAQPEETKPEVKKQKKEDTEEESGSAKGDTDGVTASSDLGAAKSSKCEDPETGDMIHTPQFHHPHHPHHRSFQGRMPFMRAMSMEQRWQDLASLLSLPGAPDHFAHPTHPGYPGHGLSHSHYEAQRNVLLHNATLAPPVGDLNSTGPYHNVGGSSNLGSAVATSMNLTNSSEPIGAESGAAYKSEPNDMMYYHAPASDSINQTTDGFLSSLLNDEDLHLMDMAMNDGKYKIPSFALSTFDRYE
ncbi:hypothetical protein KM043_006605 [Ampulex compressa]|nr:hypothetical protein KM043_006605 [Ampulex compressa]